MRRGELSLALCAFGGVRRSKCFLQEMSAVRNHFRMIKLEPMLLFHSAFVLESYCRQEQGGDSTFQVAVVRPCITAGVT